MNISLSTALSLEETKAKLLQIIAEATSSKAAPARQTPNQPVVVATLTPVMQQALGIISRFFSKSIQTEMLKPIVTVLWKNPEITSPLLHLLNTLKNSKLDDSTIARTITLVQSFQEHFARHQPTLPEHSRSLGSMQWAQWLSKIAQALETAKLQGQSTNQLVNFLADTWAHSPQHFERELIGVTTALQHNFTLTQYQALTHEVDPIRLALNLIVSQKKTPPAQDGAAAVELKTFPGALKQALYQNEVKPTLTQWENRLGTALPWSAEKNTAAFIAHWPQEIIGTAPQGQDHRLVISAIDDQVGLMPPEQWSVTTDATQLSLQGCFLLLSALPPGWNRITFKSRKHKIETSFDFLWNQLFSSETAPEPPTAETPEALNFNQTQAHQAYAHLAETTQYPVAGSVQWQLNAQPFVLMSPYTDQPTPKPLQFHFHFLADWVNPAHRFSPDRFLSFNAAPVVQEFNAAIAHLNRQGLNAYPAYLASLEKLFGEFKNTVHLLPKSLETAQRFLRDTVLLYLMGKTPSEAAIQLAEGSPRGDVMASILGTTAGLHSYQQQPDLALVQLHAATTLANNQPYLKNLLSEFLQRLKAATQTPAHDQPLWPTPMPVIVPRKTDVPADPKAYLEVDLFLKNFRVEATISSNTA